MGLLKAGAGALGGVLADTWREFFYCDSLPPDVLAAKGVKRISDRGRSSNTKGESNIISDGSIIAVNEGQFMIIVEQGAIVDACGEAGQFVFDKSTEPSLFFGQDGLGDRFLKTFERIGSRFTFGGDTGKDQRVYFFNKKEIMGNKYGTASPVPFRVVDANIGLDVDISVRCNGEYSYRIVDPMLFYKNVCGNVEEPYTRDNIDSQLKSELLTALQPAFARISAMGVRYSAVPAHTEELSAALNEVLSEKWSDLRGIEVASFGVNTIAASPEDEAMIKELQKAAVMRDPTMAAANIAAAQSDAMRMAASNENGAMMGFMGMGMANAIGGMNPQGLYGQGGGQPNVPQSQYAQAPSGGFGAVAGAATAVGSWACGCGTQNTGKFCSNCGKPKPEPAAANGWTCGCGTQNTGKFCSNCGAQKPETPGTWSCPTCGTQNTGGFCSNCGGPRP
ncbi:MAG: SPFH domain-containing protein [Slackia sp.]|uniref:SPFH domain-containing protein n=1 Tax=uncultured Slackia sp. TaxID=665903 RepID=UPI00280538B2|nr:SPFH domain-containing protein [uncultured Slackia sp.]MDU6011845.1 SPFH domain-containing protein [Slackia sp.]